MSALRVLILMGMLFLAGCETAGGTLYTYAAQGTVIQAERLVAMVYGNPAKPLPYGGPDIDRPLERMRARWPQVKAALVAGSVGMSENGEIVFRAAGDPALKKLLRQENTDRRILYHGVCNTVGYSGDLLAVWLPYVEDTFANEWIKQASPGWWYQSADLVWRQK